MTAVTTGGGIFVLGMHRTGTSAVTRLLLELGAHMPGPPMPANDANPEGFWEPQDVVDIHDRFLAEVGRDWRSLEPLPPSAFEGEAADQAREALESLVEAAPGPWSGRWVVKDPRLCRLLPLWQDVGCFSAAARPRALLVFRSPLASAASLKTRDGMGEAESLLLWMSHYLDAERATRGTDRRWIRFESLWQDGDKGSDVIEPRLSLPDSVQGSFSNVLRRRLEEDELRLSMNEVLKPKLVHHRHDSEETLQRLRCFPPADKVWRACIDFSRGREAEGRRLMDAARAEAEGGFERWLDLQQEPALRLWIDSRDPGTQSLQEGLARAERERDEARRENRALRRELDQAAAWRDKTRAENSDLVEELGKTGAALLDVTSQLEDRQREIDRLADERRRMLDQEDALKAELVEAEEHQLHLQDEMDGARRDTDRVAAELDRVLASRSYRLLNPLRNCYGLLRRLRA